MLGKLVDKNQREIFRTRLEDLINPHHELALPHTKNEPNARNAEPEQPSNQSSDI